MLTPGLPGRLILSQLCGWRSSVSEETTDSREIGKKKAEIHSWEHYSEEGLNI